MRMTGKLYYQDAYLHEFEAVVTGCEAVKRGFAVELDRTAFVPEGGGQSADTGTIADARVSDVQEKDGRILHYVDRALAVGEHVVCALDFEQRRRRMQNHSGEHVFSGIAHKKFGAENVGFHMADECMTIDFDRELDFEQLSEVEYEANLAVRANVPIRAYFPDAAELAALEYRSKKELDGAVRIVEIAGIDRCACCAPHVSATGEIGLIKLLTAERHRGGVRLTLLCGMDAVDDYRRKQQSATAISALLSAKRDEIAPAVERLLETESQLKARLSELSMGYAGLLADRFAPTEGNICVFDEVLSDAAARELVNRLVEKCAVAALFMGSDEKGWHYIIGSRRVDLRACAKTINAAVSGRGGGRSEMIQGSSAAAADTIRSWFERTQF